MPAFRFTAAVLETPDPQGLARSYQRLLGGHEDEHELVRVLADPAGHPFRPFARR